MGETIIDGTGNTYSLKVYKENSILSREFTLEVAKGNVEGYSVILFSGENNDLGTTEETIRTTGGRYPFPSENATFSVLSDNINDTSTGTGARTILLTLLDETTGDEFLEIVTMNGTTSVNLVNSAYRLNGAQVLTSGTGNVNAGNIDILNGSDNLGRIVAGQGLMRQTIYTVPSGHTLYLTDYLATSGKDDEIVLNASAFINGIFINFSKQFLYESNFFFRPYGKIGLPALSDIETTASKIAGGASGRITLTTEWLQIKNTEF